MNTTCYKCNKTYSTKYRLKHHSCKANKVAKTYPCPDCNKVFNYKHHLTQHLNKAYRCVDKNKLDYRKLYFDIKDKYDDLLSKINHPTSKLIPQIIEFEEPEQDLINIKSSIDINTKEQKFIIKIKETLNKKSFNKESSNDYFKDAKKLLKKIKTNVDDKLIINRLEYYSDVVDIKNKYIEIIYKLCDANYDNDPRYDDEFVFGVQEFISSVKQLNKLLKNGE